MHKIITLFSIDNIVLFLISVLPISLLISTGVSEFLSILLVILFIIKSFKKNIYFYKNFYFLILIILWILLILNLIFSKYPENTIFRSLGFIKHIIFIFAIIYYLKIKNNLNIIFCVWTITLLVVGFDIIFEYIFKHNILGFASPYEDRIASFLGKELKIGHFVLGFSFICSGFFFEKYKYSSNIFIIIGFFLIFFFISSIILTGERSNTIKALLGLMIYLLLFSKKIININKKKIFLIFTTTIIFIFYSSQKIQNRFNVFIIDLVKDKGLVETYKGSQHAAHYHTAIEILKSNLFFGVGNKNFRIECQNEKYYNPSYARSIERCATHPHQIYLEFLAEHGIIGTAGILTIIFYTIYKSLIIYRKNNNLIHLGSIIFIIITFIPMLPSGSFFTSFAATIFWINFSIMIFFNLKNNKNT